MASTRRMPSIQWRKFNFDNEHICGSFLSLSPSLCGDRSFALILMYELHSLWSFRRAKLSPSICEMHAGNCFDAILSTNASHTLAYIHDNIVSICWCRQCCIVLMLLLPQRRECTNMRIIYVHCSACGMLNAEIVLYSTQARMMSKNIAVMQLHAASVADSNLLFYHFFYHLWLAATIIVLMNETISTMFAIMAFVIIADDCFIIINLTVANKMINHFISIALPQLIVVNSDVRTKGRCLFESVFFCCSSGLISRYFRLIAKHTAWHYGTISLNRDIIQWRIFQKLHLNRLDLR